MVDSTYVDMEFPAVAGVHYESLGEKNELILPANQNVLKLNVIVKREDAGLRKNARKLVLRLLPSDDFQTGEVNKLVKNITISDKPSLFQLNISISYVQIFNYSNLISLFGKGNT